jgi:tetratricopeptide (TPR) repeat protein
MLLFSLLFLANFSYAQAPKPEFVLALSNSVAKVNIEDKNGQLGVGSGVVVAVNHVATNCHVIANARGIAVNKLGNSYAPIALKADWHHDLCILKFDDLPLKPFEFGESAKLQYEQHILALGFSGNSPRPVESFGTVKALIPLDDGLLIRTTAGFRMGASGGALLDYQGKLVGFTTFKSPGRQGNYYSLPVEWVSKLLDQPDISLTTQTEHPFWDVAEKDRPFFMQAVQPTQTQAWSTLEIISKAWVNVEKDNPEAWLSLGMAQEGLLDLEKAKNSFNKVLALAPKHSSAFYQLGVIAMAQNDVLEANKIGKNLEAIDPDFAEDYNIDLGLIAKPAP